MEKDTEKKIAWYDSGNRVTDLIIITILLIIIISQSFAISGGFSLTLFGSIINHNSTYLFVLIYFILIKTSFGKKYFNYLNLILIFLYLITTITSFLTVVQAFSLNTVLEFTINFVFVIYLIHTMFRNTRVWKEFKLYNSPFNELTNEWFFYSICVLSIFLLAVDLISTIALSGVILSGLDAIFLIFFGRYIYLYREFLDSKKLDSNNKGNFDDVRKALNDGVDDVKDKVQIVLDKTDIDEKVVEVAGIVADEGKEVKEKIDEFVKDKEIDKKIEKVKDKIVDNEDTKKKTTKKKGDKK